MINYNKIYITSTKNAPSTIDITDVPIPVHLVTPIINFDLTFENTVDNYYNSTIFKNTLLNDWLYAKNEYGQDIDVFVDKYPDLPEVSTGNIVVNPTLLNNFVATDLTNLIDEIDDHITDKSNDITALDGRLDTVEGNISDINTLDSTQNGRLDTAESNITNNSNHITTLESLKLFPDQFDIKNVSFIYSCSGTPNKCVEFISASGANGFDVSRLGGGNAPSYTTATIDSSTFYTPFTTMSTPTGYTYLISSIISPIYTSGFVSFEAVIAFSTGFTDTANNSIYFGISTNSNVPSGESLTGYSMFLRRNPTVNSGNWQALKVVNGTTTIVNSTSTGFTQNSWIKLKIHFNKANNSALYYINGTLIHTETSLGMDLTQFWRCMVGQTSNVVNSSTWTLRYKDALILMK